RVPEGPEFHRLRSDRRLGVDVLVEPLQVVRDAVDEQRYVVQQGVARKDAFRGDGDAGDDPVEPATDEDVAGRPKPRGKVRSKGTQWAGGHGGQLVAGNYGVPLGARCPR